MYIVFDSTKAAEHTWTVTSTRELTQGPLGAETFSAGDLVQAQRAGSLTENGEQLIGTLCMFQEFATRLDEAKRDEIVITTDSGLDPSHVTIVLKGILERFSLTQAFRTGQTVVINYHEVEVAAEPSSS